MNSPLLRPLEAQRAFPSHPRVDRYFVTEPNESARQRMIELLRRGDGPGLLIGVPGVGKTMLVEAIAAELPAPLRVLRLACTQLCTRRALLQAMLRGLGLPYNDRDEGQLRLSLIDELESKDGPVALLVDEAQSLPLRLLEELRLLANVAIEGAPRLRLLLAGTPALDEALTAPELAALNQRISARCYLSPLSYEQTTQYVRAHIAAAGGDPDTLLEPGAYQALHAAADGVPRLINQVADRALVLAVERGEQSVDAAAVQTAWADLNQLPAPWHSPAQSESECVTADASAIEFGALDDLDESFEVGRSLDAAPSFAPAPTGVWNADEGLSSLDSASTEADETSKADDCVSLAFPTLDGVAVTPSADEAVSDDAGSEQEPADARLAADPFDEAFDEEEVVLDRYADLATVARADAEAVVNRTDVEFNRLFQALDPAVESLVAEVTADEAADALGFTVLQAEPPVAAVPEVEEAKLDEAPFEEAPFDEPELEELAVDEPQAYELADEEGEQPAEPEIAATSIAPTPVLESESADTSALLVVEPDDEPAAPVRTAEYAQLFANLRQG